MRTNDPDYCVDVLTQLDAMTVETILGMAGLVGSAGARAMAFVPARYRGCGGLGVSSLQHLAPIAAAEGKKEAPVRYAQRTMYREAVVPRLASAAVAQLDADSLAIARSNAHPTAARLLTDSRIAMDDRAAKVVIASRLGASFAEWQHASCNCDKVLTVAHAMTCQKWATRPRVKRHNLVAQALMWCASIAGCDFTLETRMEGMGPNRFRPDLDGAVGARLIAVDVTIVSPTASGVKSDAYMAAADKAAADKTNKWKYWCDKSGREFVPFAMEVTGAMHTKALQFIATLARFRATSEGTPEAFFHYRDMFTVRVMTAFARGTGAYLDPPEARAGMA